MSTTGSTTGTAQGGSGALPRRVVLHIGMEKTGSTALQTGFVVNRDVLRDHLAVDYPEAPSDGLARSGAVTNGNAGGLRAFLAPNGRHTSEQASQEAYQELVRMVEAARSPTLLLSSEALYPFANDRMVELEGWLRARSIELSVVLVVRDLAGQVLSAYSQDVKRKRYGGTFHEFLTESRSFTRHLRSLRQRLGFLTTLVGRGNVEVIHFDSHRSDLLGAVLARICGPLPDLDLVEPGRDVNRSLSAREIAYMRHLNQSGISRAAALRVSDAFMAMDRLDAGSAMIDERDVAYLHQEFGATVRWINDEFLTADTLHVDGGAKVGSAPEIDVGPGETFLLDALRAVAEAAPPVPAVARRMEELRDGLHQALMAHYDDGAEVRARDERVDRLSAQVRDERTKVRHAHATIQRLRHELAERDDVTAGGGSTES